MNLVPYTKKQVYARPTDCPFCGSFRQACAMMTNEFGVYSASIHCLNCEAFGPMSGPHDTPQDAEHDARTRWDGDDSTGLNKIPEGVVDDGEEEEIVFTAESN